MHFSTWFTDIKSFNFLRGRYCSYQLKFVDEESEDKKKENEEKESETESVEGT